MAQIESLSNAESLIRFCALFIKAITKGGNNMWTVYKHTAPNGKVYIGITHRKPKSRWQNGKGYESNHHFYNAITCYGWNNIEHTIVQDGLTQKQAEDLERELIFKYKSYDKRFGYNKALGGHALSEESRKKIADTRKEKQIVPWNKGIECSPETKKKISDALTGKHHTVSDIGRQHIAEGKRGEKNPNYGKKLTDYQKACIAEACKKPVIQIDGDKEIQYASVKEAGLATNIADCNITRVCKGQRLTAGGYKWKYAEWR